MSLAGAGAASQDYILATFDKIKAGAVLE